MPSTHVSDHIIGYLCATSYLPVKSVEVLCVCLCLCLFSCPSVCFCLFDFLPELRSLILPSVISTIAILVKLFQMIWGCIASFVVCYSGCLSHLSIYLESPLLWRASKEGIFFLGGPEIQKEAGTPEKTM